MAESGIELVAPDSTLGEGGAAPEQAPVSEAPDSPSQETESERQERIDRGDGRDPQGRFVPKGATNDPLSAVAPPASPADGTAPTQAAQAPLDGVTPPPDGTAPPLATSPTSADPAGRSPDANAAAANAEPLVIPFGGTEFEIRGSRLTDDGLIVPKDQVQVLREFIGKGLKMEHERAAIKHEKAAVRQERELAAAEKKAFASQVDEQFAIAAMPDEMQFAEAWLAYGLELRSALPTLQRERELSQREAKLALQQRVNEPEPEEIQAQTEAAVAGAIQEQIAEWQQHPDLKVLTPADWAQVQQAALRDPGLYFYHVGARPTRQEQAAGLAPGDLAFRADRLGEAVSTRLSLRQEFVAEQQRMKQAAEEAKKVAALNASAMAKAPPVGGPPAVQLPAATPESQNGQKTQRDLDAEARAWRREMGLDR